MSSYFKNLETGKLHLDFAKEDYQSLPLDVKSDIKRFFLWSRNTGHWVSKAKEGNLHYAETLALKAGLSKGNDIGEKISYAEKIEKTIEKANERSERFSSLSENLKNKSSEKITQSMKMLEGLPMGQPILVGHYSERSHRALINKSHNTMDKAMELEKKGNYYQDRAEASKSFGDTSKFSDIQYLTERVKECKKILNNCMEGDYKESIKDKLSFFENKIKEAEEKGVPVFDKEKLEGKKFIRDRHGWRKIIKLNKTTVSVDSGYSWADKIEYSKIKESK